MLDASQGSRNIEGIEGSMDVEGIEGSISGSRKALKTEWAQRVQVALRAKWH